jgi:carbonic anhydrase/acetyltransferase-like protein (isoleucine patch superfamily)
VGEGALVAAGSVVPEGFEVPPRAMVAGVPAKVKKTDLKASMVDKAVQSYVDSARAYRDNLRRLDG